jgi:hypothetical protein
MLSLVPELAYFSHSARIEILLGDQMIVLMAAEPPSLDLWDHLMRTSRFPLQKSFRKRYTCMYFANLVSGSSYYKLSYVRKSRFPTTDRSHG